MKIIGIIAEFNPFHNGHEYLINKCKRDLNADYCIVVMSGDFVERGAPAIISKFDRTKMALRSGADLVLELPIYYSLGSAEYFALGAVSLLNKLGVVDYLCFGSETPYIDQLDKISEILVNEPQKYKIKLNEFQKNGDSFPTARAKAIKDYLSVSDNETEYNNVLSSPNSILAIEYLKALKITNSSIIPYTIMRKGAGYHSDSIEQFPSAQGIRNALFEKENSFESMLKELIPSLALSDFTSYNGKYIDSNDFSMLLYYKLVSEKNQGYTKYMDVTEDISNRIISSLDKYENFDSFCTLLKSKNLTYTRISRCLMHILLNITKENMDIYKNNDFTSYGRILGLNKASTALLAKIKEISALPMINRLKDADKMLNPIALNLLKETLCASQIYNAISQNGIHSEYSLKQIIL